MEVEFGYLAPLAERVRSVKPRGQAIYEFIEPEKVKAYLPFEHQFVSNLLTQKTVRNWETGGYFIASQTGSGKSTLIMEVIAPVAISRGARILLIVPRVALAMQYKKEIASEYCPEALDELQEEGIRKRTNWGPFDVYVMQSLVKKQEREEIWRKRATYDFVLMDEGHVFLSDSVFVPFTYELFRFLVCEVGRNCKRVYLTATPDIILTEVAEMESKIPGRPLPGRNWAGDFKEEIYLTLYQFKEDYRYLSPRFFEKEETILKRLEELPSNEKAVIFVRSKNQGLRLQKILGGAEKAVYMDAENKMTMERETLSSIINEQSFKPQFLIATRFLDVGVNLKDLKIRTVVLFQRFKEDILQMLGRKRLTSGETVNLYLKVPTRKEVLGEIEEMEEDYQAMMRAQKRYETRTENWSNEIPMPLFLYEKNGKREIGCNHFSYRINEYHRRQLEAYVDGTEDELGFRQTFIRTVLSWFPMHKEAVDIEKEDKALSSLEEELDALLESYLGQELDKKAALELCNHIFCVMKISRRSDQKDNLGLSSLKKAFEQYGIRYGIFNQSRGGKAGIWVVQKGEWK
ncbi:MAG: DEAD/DEAH box helicase family protein [Hungatella sp.]|jgi:superfamily II DNA or RNA helicase|nr:DEAD/DEAH box helicase family protein [Hungatella sp.]